MRIDDSVACSLVRQWGYNNFSKASTEAPSNVLGTHSLGVLPPSLWRLQSLSSEPYICHHFPTCICWTNPVYMERVSTNRAQIYDHHMVALFRALCHDTWNSVVIEGDACLYLRGSWLKDLRYHDSSIRKSDKDFISQVTRTPGAPHTA